MKLKKNLNLGKSTSSILQKMIAPVLLVFIYSSLNAQTVTVGTGTGSTTSAPISSYYGYSYSESIYHASDIIAGGGSMGVITTLRYFYVNNDYANSNNWTVFIGTTDKNTFANTSDWETSGNMTQVFSGTVTFPANGNWLEITLTTPFQWDGTSNLVIGVDENAPNYSACCGANFQTTTAVGSRTIYYRNDSTNPDPSSPPSGTGTLTSFPNIQLEMTPAPACVGTPAMPTLAVVPNNTICEGTPFELSVQESYFFSGITYQWQQFDGITWNDLTNDTINVFTSTGISANTSYRVLVGCENSGMEAISDAENMVINMNPVLSADLPHAAICTGEIATVNASGAASYSWSPATGLDNTTSATVNANPTSSTVYTVTGTDLNGCIGTAAVTVIPMSEVVAELSVTPEDICDSGIPVLISVEGLPVNASGGTWNYRFLEEDGITIAQNWSANNTFTYLPNQDASYTFYYQLENSFCPGEVLDSVPFNFVVGFGAQVTTVDYDCNNLGGSIILSDVFGQVETEELYMNDFSPTADFTALTLTGSANIADNRAVLTPSATGQTGYMELNVPAFTSGLNNSFNISFNMTADQPINNFGTGGADGLTYSFANDATPAANGSGHNGKGTKLRLCFDAADNGSENGNATGIYLVYGWTAGNAFGPASTQTLEYSSNTSLWKYKTDVPVEMSIDSEGRVTVIVDGVTVFSQVQLPASYQTEDVSSWKHLFSAATGGDALRHAISNLNISSETLNFGISSGSALDVPTSWQEHGDFTDLAPGTYHVWLSKDTDALCGKNIQTVEILNTNPIVTLGSDTTICQGETLVLDAGNPGSTYTWSNTSEVTQSIEVQNEGAYVAYVVAANGCIGIGTINVDVLEAPEADGIYMQGIYPTMNFTVLNASDANSYNWDFGDGTSVSNAPASISHSYSAGGTYDVTVTLINECGSTDLTQEFDVINTVSITENSMEGPSIYPNPVSGMFTVHLDNESDSDIRVYTTTGALVYEYSAFNGSHMIDAAGWEKGVYLVKVTNQNLTSVSRVVVQ